MFNKSNLAVSKITKEKGVEFSPEWTMGTDGHILLAVQTMPKEMVQDAPNIEGKTPMGEYEKFWLDAKVAQSVFRAIPKSPAIPILENAFVIDNGDGTKSLKTTDFSSVQSFPISGEKAFVGKWESCFPTKEPVLKIKLNAKLLKTLMDTIIKALESRYAYPVDFSFYSDTDAIRVDAKNNATGQEIRGLIMPMSKD